MVLIFRIHEGYVYEAFDMRADHLLIGCLLDVWLYSGWSSKLFHIVAARPAMLWVTVLLIALSSTMPRLVAWR